MWLFRRLALFLLSLLFPALVWAVPAFPGAEGFGSTTRHAFDTAHCGAGDPTVYYVSTTAASGTGSLAECVQATGKRICVFEVSGEIEVNGSITASDPCLAVYGQTAPSPGIHLYDTSFKIATTDVLVQHLRIRRGDNVSNRDSLQFFGANRAIADHMTLAWATDETLSVVGNSQNVTVSNTLVAEALDNGYGSKQCIVNSNDSESVSNLSLHHNLFALGKTRNCKMRQRFQAEIAMNVWYGLGPASTKANLLDLQADPAGLSSAMRLDYWSNTIVQGPGSGSLAQVSDCSAAKCPPSGALIYVGTGASNYNDLWGAGGAWGTLFDGSLPSGTYQSGTAVASSGLTSQTAAEAYAQIITDGDVGSRPLDQAAQDTGWINNVINQSATVGTTTYTMASSCAPDCNVFGVGTASVWPDCVEAGDCADYAVSAKPTFAVNTRTLSDLRGLADPWGDDDVDGWTNFEETLHDNYTAAVQDTGASVPTPTPGGTGATPSIRSAQASTDTGNVTSPHNIVLPATIEAGDWLGCFVNFDGGSTTYTWDNSTAGTWTEDDSQLNEILSVVLHKTADGTEDGLTLAVSTGDGQEMAAYCVAIQDWDSSTPVELNSANVDTATPDPPSLTPSWGSSIPTRFIAVAHADLVGLNASDYPTGYSDNQYSVLTVDAGGVGQAFATKEGVGGSAEDPAAFTFTASDGTVAYTLAVPGLPNAYTIDATAEVCGSGLDEDANGTTPCGSGSVAALVGGGCDRLCDGLDDKDRDGVSSVYDCDDTNPLIFEGYERACGSDGWQTCQADGTWTTCSETERCAAVGSGVCYYVDPVSGVNTNAGTTRATAKADFQDFNFGCATGHCVALAAGDVVYVLSGTITTDYTYSAVDYGLYIRAKDGTATEPIKVLPYPGDWWDVTIDPAQSAAGYAIMIQDSDYVYVEGLKVSGGYSAGIKASAATGDVIRRNLIFENDGLENDNNTGIEWHTITDGVVSHNFLYDNYDTGDDGQNNSQITLYQGTGSRLHHNRIWFNAAAEAGTTTGRCIKYKHAQASSSADVEIDNNILVSCGAYAIESAQANSYIHDNIAVDGDSFFRMADLGGSYYPVGLRLTKNTGIGVGMNLLRFQSGDATVSNLVITENVFEDDRSTAYNNDTRLMSIGHYGTAGLYTEVITGGAITIDRNCYYNASQSFSGSIFGSIAEGDTYASFSAWQADGWDVGGFEEDPVLDSNNQATSTNCADLGADVPYSGDGLKAKKKPGKARIGLSAW